MKAVQGFRMQDIMVREVITIDPSATVIFAAETMAHHRIGALPVVSPDRTVLGLITASDLVWVHARSRPRTDRPTRAPEADDHGARDQASYWYQLGLAESRRLRWDPAESLQGEVVSSVYSPGAITLEPSASVTEGARLMSEHRVHHLVITEKGCLVGMVSALDIVRAQCRTTAGV